MIVFIGGGGGGRMGVSQQSNEGIGSGPEDGEHKGLIIICGALLLLFAYFYFFA